MTTCERIAAYVQRAQWDAISPEARDKLKQHLLDALGCALGAVMSPVIAATRREERSGGCFGPCSRIACGTSTPERAAFHNAALIRYLDFMDTFIAPGEACHPSDNIGALLAAAELADSSGRDLLTAMAIAYHVQCVLTASGVRIMGQGFDHTLPLAISIAAGTSYLLGLDRERTAHAIALCAVEGLSLGAARSGRLVPQWKGLASAATAFSAIHNVRLAAEGITGPLHAFEGPLGLKQVLGRPFAIRWEQEGYDAVLACSIKRFNAEFHAQSLIEGILELRAAGLRADQVRRMDVDIFKAGHEMIGGGGYVDPQTVETKEDADHSLPYLAAAALLDGDVQPEQFEPGRIQARDIRELMPRIRSHVSLRCTREYPLWLPVRIRVSRFGAPPLRLEKRDYEGFYRRPIPWRRLLAKFHRVASPALEETRAAVVDCVHDLEHRPATDLIGELAAAPLGVS
ncbi:MAG TPA: MmgE/PrpD family protein [Bryobacteraceae bacterium]|jgi:2-methylcitrate dehydratase|nr:MmgE/PrpD family protein [Bryobacteraceae bacterium]